MKLKNLFLTALFLMVVLAVNAQFPRFKVLAFYSEKVEPAHVDFARQAIQFFEELTVGNGFVFESTTNLDDLNAEKLKDYSVIMMLNDFPHTEKQQQAFRDYMENGWRLVWVSRGSLQRP